MVTLKKITAEMEEVEDISQINKMKTKKFGTELNCYMTKITYYGWK